MIKLTVSYPTTEGATFDHDYYANSHVPLANSVFGCVKSEVEKGLDGPNVALASFYFESMEAMQGSMANPRMGEVMADLANYTTIAPVMQVSQVVS